MLFREATQQPFPKSQGGACSHSSTKPDKVRVWVEEAHLHQPGRAGRNPGVGSPQLCMGVGWAVFGLAFSSAPGGFLQQGHFSSEAILAGQIPCRRSEWIPLRRCHAGH